MTTPFKSDLLRTLSERGFIQQGTDLAALDKAAASGVVTGYIGFDATADSLHAGSLMQIMLLRWLQKTGHKPIALMGGGTTKIGDPSGKDEARQLLTDDLIAKNIQGIGKIFANYLDFGAAKNAAILVDNAEWLDKLEYIPFLREVGRHFSVNRMLTMDSVKLRLDRDQPLSFLEFNYMILQSYDFLELQKRYGCVLQMGGSDQWGNIVMGVDLTRRMAQRDVFGLTSPLLTTSSGAKMGKTAEGAVWLNAERLSPYDFWQYWRNTEDADVGKFLRLFTELPLDEIARLEKLQGAEINEAKKVLADEVTTLCHGQQAASEAAEQANKTFVLNRPPEITRSVSALEKGIPLIDLLVDFKWVESKSKARQAFSNKAVRINDLLIEDEKTVINLALTGEKGCKIAYGKKHFVIIKPDKMNNSLRATIERAWQEVEVLENIDSLDTK